VKKIITRVIVLAVLAGGVAFLIIKKPWASGEDEIKFQTVAVGKGSIAAQVTAAGALSARSTILVGAQVSGRVVEIHADFNDKVKKGQIIAKLDDSVLRAQIEQMSAAHAVAVANQRRAEVAVKDAERQLVRQKALQDQQLIAGAVVEQFEVTLDTARASLLAAKAQVSQSLASLKQGKTNLSYATIYSPVDGTVLSRAVDVGQTVAASLQAPTLFTIAEDLSRMQIDTAVAEADVGRLADGMKATFTVDAFSGKTFDGVVRQVRNSPTTTQGVVTYVAVIDVENKDLQLRPGMTANVTFVLEQVADAVKIPNAALRFKLSAEQMRALAAHYGVTSLRGGPGGPGGPGGRPPRGGAETAGGAPGGAPSGGAPMAGGMPTGALGGSPGGPSGRTGDRKMVWKLENGRPRPVLIKPGLTDGSSTQLVEGDLKPTDLLITEVTGLPATSGRRVGAF
jgi:HlyD family secretion protein